MDVSRIALRALHWHWQFRGKNIWEKDAQPVGDGMNVPTTTTTRTDENRRDEMIGGVTSLFLFTTSEDALGVGMHNGPDMSG
jgi:hypothetical protein